MTERQTPSQPNTDMQERGFTTGEINIAGILNAQAQQEADSNVNKPHKKNAVAPITNVYSPLPEEGSPLRRDFIVGLHVAAEIQTRPDKLRQEGLKEHTGRPTGQEILVYKKIA